MKIFLCDLSHTQTVSASELTIPLNIGFIKAYAVNRFGDSVDIALFKDPQKFLDRFSVEKPDVVGFSNYTWNVNLNHHIGRRVRESLPEALIVGGGPNLDDEEDRRRDFLETNSFYDFLIDGGGEEPFTELLAWWQSDRGDMSRLPDNLVWMAEDQLHQTKQRRLQKQIDNLVSPYLTGCLDEFLDAGMVPLFESNRGCPFKCTFCAWGAASRDLLRRMDFDTTIAEFEYVAKRSSHRNWVLCDANFGILKRDVMLAEKLRELRDTVGRPVNVQTFVAKNVTERNLAIGAILNDMTTATMSFQSLEADVLENIERGNISLDTYREYQSQFDKIGHRTYSELIIPLPGETRATHIAALRNLIDSGVHELHVHNLRMLPGTKINSRKTREEFGFRTRFRLIHGDAGIYTDSNGEAMRIFEYEESLRETTTMTEADLFYFRKLQFFIEFAWNIDVYGPLLKAAHVYGVHPLDVLMKVVEDPPCQQNLDDPHRSKVQEFLALFDKLSEEEWFDSEDHIKEYFAKPKNFSRLINLEFDKLNILCSVILLRDYKESFDLLMKAIINDFAKMPERELNVVSEFTFKRFPGVGVASFGGESEIELPVDIGALGKKDRVGFSLARETSKVRFFESPKRREMRHNLTRTQSHTLSKILNTQRYFLRDLKLSIDPGDDFTLPLLFCSQ